MSTKLKVAILSIIILILAFAGIYYFTSNKTSNNDGYTFEPVKAEDVRENFPGLSDEEIDAILNTPLTEAEQEAAKEDLAEAEELPIIVDSRVDEEDPTKIWFTDDRGGEGYFYADEIKEYDDELQQEYDKAYQEWLDSDELPIPDHLVSIDAYAEYKNNPSDSEPDYDNPDDYRDPIRDTSPYLDYVEPDCDPIGPEGTTWIYEECNPDGTTPGEIGEGTYGDLSQITIE